MEEEVSILQVAAKAGSDVVCTNLLPADLFFQSSRGWVVWFVILIVITEKTLNVVLHCLEVSMLNKY